MKSTEILQFQALKHKIEVLGQHPDLEHGDDSPAWMRDDYNANEETRNICGMIPVALFDEIQRLGGILSISKRRMIEMALRDIAINANKALNDVGFDSASITYFSAGEVTVDQE
jgi:hypothetical protein